MIFRLFYKVLLPFILVIHVNGQDTLLLTYNKVIEIALGESFTAQSYNLQKESQRQYYNYYKAQFKPRLDVNLHTPVWEESVKEIDQADDLPVYNSYGSMKLGGKTKFTYVLPTGGDIALSSELYRRDINTFLATTREDLADHHFKSRFWVSFHQPVFTKNKLKEDMKEAEYNYSKTKYYFTRTQMNIVYNVTRGFYYLYNASKKVEIAEEKLNNSRESLRIAKLKSSGGRIAKADVLSAEVWVARDEADLLSAKNKLETEKDQFKHLIGIPLYQPINIVADLDVTEFEISELKAIEEALKNRLEIKESEIDINLKKIEYDKARREHEFKGVISAYYDLTGISTLGAGPTVDLIGSSFDNIAARPPNRGISFTLTIPVYDWGRGKALEQRASINLKEQKLKHENLHVRIEREVRETIRRVTENRKQLEIHGKNLEVARKSLQIAQIRYENGDISSQDLAVEQQQLANIQLDYLYAFVSYQLAMNDLKRKTLWDFENNRSYVLEEWNDSIQ